MLVLRHQNTGQNHNQETVNKHFEYVAMFRYLGMTVTYLHPGLSPQANYTDRATGGRIILKFILERWDGAVWTRLIWLRTGTCGGLL
jgi:hypothetical protein